jgi:hypothetical protein
VSATIFTYYTKDLNGVFLDNLNSLISNSDQQYDTIVICSQDAVPQPINKALYKTHRVIRVYPDLTGQRALRRLSNGERFLIHPFFLTAISYSNSEIVTIFDSNLFIVNRLPAYSGCNLFYKNHAGLVSPALFTIKTNSILRNAFNTTLASAEFTDQQSINRFGYVIANAMPIKPYDISNGHFVFSNPGDPDPIVLDKLIALDFSNLDKTREIYKKMMNERQSFLPKVTTLTRITNNLSNRIGLSKKPTTIDDFLPSQTANPYYRILFKYTSRSRPDLFYRGLCSIFDNCDSSNFIILCSLDLDDPTLSQYQEFAAKFPTKHIKIEYGNSKNKIDAINRDLNQHTGRWDILVNMSDDMIFTEYGFDQIIRRAFNTDLDQFIHFNDGIQFANLCSMTIEGRPYYERFRYVYHPSYTSLWCDLEAQEVAKKLGKYKYLGNHVNILKHLHPTAGLAQFDEQYRRTEDRQISSADRSNYDSRKKLGFPSDTISIVKNQPAFSILIASLESRQEMFLSVLEELSSQINEYDGMCEILWELDNGSKTTGEKRNSLLQRATGKYLAFFDDDDWPSNRYIKLILSAVENNPDCCSLLGEITVDGLNPELFEHSIVYSDWRTNSAGRIKYERNPNHLNPIKSSIAKSISFPSINHGEDKAWSDKLKNSQLLKTEAKIEEVIYFYRYVTKK